MNQFTEATKELVSTEVSQFFGTVQGKWNRHLEVAVLDFITQTIDEVQDEELKQDLKFFSRQFKDSHERFCLKSLVEVLGILKSLEFGLEVNDNQLRLTSLKSDDEIYTQLDELYAPFAPF